MTLITAFTQDKGFPPTYREMAEHMGVSSGAAQSALLALRDKGLVTWISGSPRTFQVLPKEKKHEEKTSPE